jgi:hypothetical protein
MNNFNKSLPDDIVISHILPFLFSSSLSSFLLSGSSVHNLTIKSLERNPFFTDANNFALPDLIELIGFIRRILKLLPKDKATMLVILPSSNNFVMELYSGYVPNININFSGLQVIGATRSTETLVTIYHNIHINSGAINVELCNIKVINNHNNNDSDKTTSAVNQSGIWISNKRTSVTLKKCTVTNQHSNITEMSRVDSHGLAVTDGASVTTVECLYRDNGKSGVFVRGIGSSVKFVDCHSRNNQDYGVYVERGGFVKILGKSSIHHNQWYGLGCYGKHSLITIASVNVTIYKNTNDSYGSRYGYAKNGGVIQLLCK